MQNLSLFSGWFIISLLVVSSISCVSQEVNERKLVVLTNCGDPEISADIIYSIESLVGFTDSNNIEVQVEKEEEKCGYYLISNRTKFIDGVLTDYDLMLEAKTFFKLN